MDVQAKSRYGSTPLHYACKVGKTEVVEALLEKGADLHAKDNDGSTPLLLAGLHDVYVN
jgi:ankyrin repeat protein